MKKDSKFKKLVKNHIVAEMEKSKNVEFIENTLEYFCMELIELCDEIADIANVTEIVLIDNDDKQILMRTEISNIDENRMINICLFKNDDNEDKTMIYYESLRDCGTVWKRNVKTYINKLADILDEEEIEELNAKFAFLR